MWKNRYLQSRRWIVTLPYIMINQTVNFITAIGIFFFHFFPFFLTRFSFNHKKIKICLCPFPIKGVHYLLDDIVFIQKITDLFCCHTD